jgi:hypothetical protein
MLEISRKYTYLPEVVVSSAGSSTTRAARHKMEKNRSRIYDVGVVPTRGNYLSIIEQIEQNIVICRATDKSRYFART